MNLNEYFYIPSKNWKDIFFSDRFHNMYYDEINYHLREISRLTTNQVVTQLSSDIFWDKLKELSCFDPIVDDLCHSFKKQYPLAHLSSQEILRIKDDHLDPLENMLVHIVENLKIKKKKTIMWNILRLDIHQNDLIKKWEDKLKDILYFKDYLQTICLYRADLYEKANLDRQCDDVINVFLILINQLSLLNYPLKIKKKIRYKLDDDTRAILFDWCASQKKIDITDLKKIIAPVNQKPFKPIKHAKDIYAENNKIIARCKIIEKKLNINLSVRTSSPSKNRKKEEWFLNKLYFLFRFFFRSTNLPNFIIYFLRNKYFILTTITTLSYILLSPIVATAAALYLGQWSIGIASNLLFYGIALLPIWIVAANSLKMANNTIHKFLTFKKNQEIIRSINYIKYNQKYIATRLSIGIIDIPNFNIDILNKGVLSRVHKIEKLMADLQHTRWYEKLIFNKDIEISRKEAILLLKEQKETLIKSCENLSLHITNRIKDEIQVLKKSNNKMIPRIQKDQLYKIRQFVRKYSKTSTLEAFDKNTDVLTPFLEAIESQKLCFPKNKQSLCKEPWGGHSLKIPAMKGWKAIIKGMVIDSKNQKSALQIIDILTGQQSASLIKIKELITDLHGNNDRWLRAIQNHIFINLDNFPPSISIILNAEKKELVKEWYQINRRFTNEVQLS